MGECFLQNKKRFFSLAVPFAIWNFIGAVYLYFTGNLGWYGTNYFILQCSFIPFDGPLWYVFVLMILVLLSPVVIQAKKLPAVFQFVLLSGFTICCYSYCINYWQAGDFSLHWFERVVRYLPHYFLGVFTAWNGKAVLNENYNKKFIAVVASAVAVIIIFIQLKYGVKDSNTLSFVLNRLLPVAV